MPKCKLYPKNKNALRPLHIYFTVQLCKLRKISTKQFLEQKVYLKIKNTFFRLFSFSIFPSLFLFGFWCLPYPCLIPKSYSQLQPLLQAKRCYCVFRLSFTHIFNLSLESLLFFSCKKKQQTKNKKKVFFFPLALHLLWPIFHFSPSSYPSKKCFWHCYLRDGLCTITISSPGSLLEQNVAF